MDESFAEVIPINAIDFGIPMVYKMYYIGHISTSKSKM